MRSIRVRLSAVLLLFMLLVIVLGLFSMGRLNDVNQVSADISNRWLQTTRLLGDLNNLISDYRADEGAHLLAESQADQQANEREIASLDALIAQAEEAYSRIPRGESERDAFVRFVARWQDYRDVAREVIALSRADHKAEGRAMYLTTSRTTYDAANDVLEQLTERNVAEARDASDRAAAAFVQARKLIIAGIVVAALLLVAAVLYVTRTISAPLLDIAQRMRRLAENDTAIDDRGIQRNDEIGEMARAVVVFRTNAIQLMESQEALARQASGLREALQHERYVSTLQRNFVSMASHEFRTPLTVIDAHAQRLVKMKERIRPDEIVERCGRIRGTVLRMVSLIDNVLDSSRLYDGAKQLHFEARALNPMVVLRELCQIQREMAPGTEIREDFAGLPETMAGDPKLLYQALSNLLSNAIKYSRDSGAIEVTARALSSALVVEVIDQGIGIPERDVPHLFEPYFRGANVTGIAGTGVGLHLVKIITDLHGGVVSVQSREGEGSRFTLSIPIRSAEAGGSVAPTAPAGAPESTAL